MIDLYVVAIPPSLDRNGRWKDFTSNPFGANSTVIAESRIALSHVSVMKKHQCHFLLQT